MLAVEERPLTFDDVRGQKYVIESLKGQSQRNKFFSVMIFAGKYGSGKTTAARIVAMSANCNNKKDGNPCLECESCKSILAQANNDVVEIDGASNNGVDSARKIRQEAEYNPLGNYKVFIIDECHKLSSSAWDALLKTFEEPSDRVLFILCTTNENDIPDTIKSRAPVYHFTTLSREILKQKAMEVTAKHNYSITEDAIDLLVSYADGSMRNVLTLVEQMSQFEKNVDAAMVEKMLGINNYSVSFDYIEAMLKKDVKNIIEINEQLAKKGSSLKVFLMDLQEASVDLLMCKTGATVTNRSNDYLNQLKLIADKYTKDEISFVSKSISKIASRKVSDFTECILTTVECVSTNVQMIHVSKPEVLNESSASNVCTNQTITTNNVGEPTVDYISGLVDEVSEQYAETVTDIEDEIAKVMEPVSCNNEILSDDELNSLVNSISSACENNKNIIPETENNLCEVTADTSSAKATSEDDLSSMIDSVDCLMNGMTEDTGDTTSQTIDLTGIISEMEQAVDGLLLDEDVKADSDEFPDVTTEVDELVGDLLGDILFDGDLASDGESTDIEISLDDTIAELVGSEEEKPSIAEKAAEGNFMHSVFKKVREGFDLSSISASVKRSLKNTADGHVDVAETKEVEVTTPTNKSAIETDVCVIEGLAEVELIRKSNPTFDALMHRCVLSPTIGEGISIECENAAFYDFIKTCINGYNHISVELTL